MRKTPPFYKSKKNSKCLRLQKWTLLKIGSTSTLTYSTRVELHTTLIPNWLNNKKKHSQVSWESQIPWFKDWKEFHKKRVWSLWVMHPTGLFNSADKPSPCLWSENNKASLHYTQVYCWEIWYGPVLRLLDSRADGPIFMLGLGRESVKPIRW